MHDLVGAYERLNDVYRKYIESAFPLRYPNMVAERRSLYAASETLSQPPLLEPTPVYPSSGLTLSDAAVRLPEQFRDLPDIAQGLLADPNIRLWKHQWESLTTVLEDRRDLVVTTGTGSGKTECFLLPVLAEISRESRGWPISRRHLMRGNGGTMRPPIGNLSGSTQAGVPAGCTLLGPWFYIP